MTAPAGFHNAIRAARATVAQVKGWTWTYDGRMYYLRHGIDTVGTISVIPGAVEHESLLLDTIVEHLNKDAQAAS